VLRGLRATGYRLRPHALSRRLQGTGYWLQPGQRLFRVLWPKTRDSRPATRLLWPKTRDPRPATPAGGALARPLLAALVVTSALVGCTNVDTTALLDPSSGGATTVTDATKHAYSKAAANLDVERRGEFSIGNAFFNSPWVTAPATAGARDGLGPLFNARSCDACHNNDGRGRPPERDDERLISLVIQFGGASHGQHGEPLGDPHYGANLNPFAIDGVEAEGTVRISHEEIPGQFGDGEQYVLLAPRYQFEDLKYGEMPATTRFSPRVAPAVMGVGLLESVPEALILEAADPDDQNGDGISGRANRVWDAKQQRMTLGRFGWKANQPDIAHQTAGAFNAEIGMSTSLRPQQNCTNFQFACIDAPDGGSPEISDEIFAHIVNYQRMLAVPARRSVESKEVAAGAKLFAKAGCTACHRPTLTTAETPDTPWLSKQTIHPYSDLLLHDMGPALADDREDFEASGSEWRTATLWGLGLQQTVNRHTRLLHDGRARDASEAILWHGGEAAKAKEAYRTMSKKDRAALLAFLNSL